jgi:hypothetical protein
MTPPGIIALDPLADVGFRNFYHAK